MVYLPSPLSYILILEKASFRQRSNRSPFLKVATLKLAHLQCEGYINFLITGT